MRVLTALLLTVTPALAHDWYDHDCCDTRDCAPIEDVHVERVQGGYQVEIPPGSHPMAGLGVSEFVRFDDPRVRVSADDAYHACIVSSAAFMDPHDQQRTTDWMRCLYVPLEGF